MPPKTAKKITAIASMRRANNPIEAIDGNHDGDDNKSGCGGADGNDNGESCCGGADGNDDNDDDGDNGDGSVSSTHRFTSK